MIVTLTRGLDHGIRVAESATGFSLQFPGLNSVSISPGVTSLSIGGIPIVAVVCPAQATDIAHSFDRECVVVSFQGWHNGVWLDGPLAHIGKAGVLSYCPAGLPAALTVEIDTTQRWPHIVTAQSIARNLSPCHHLQSIRSALQQEVAQGSHDSIGYRAIEHNLREAIELTILVQAFGPGAVNACPTGSQNPHWRRLLKNLGLLSRSKPMKNPPPRWMSFGLLDDCDLGHLIEEINKVSAVVPLSLSSRV